MSRVMEPPDLAPPPPQANVPNIARAIEVMAASLTKQSNAMMQQYKALMQR